MYLSGLTQRQQSEKSETNFLRFIQVFRQTLLTESKVYLDVNLQKASSIVVNITGNVETWYIYNFWILFCFEHFAAGGPSESGSYRDISIMRNGKLAHTIDLYDYFVKGTYPSFFSTIRCDCLSSSQPKNSRWSF